MKKHQKHTKLVRPHLGEYGRNEWAFVGAPCGDIQKLIDRLLPELGAEKKIAYMDADHQTGDQGLENSSRLAMGLHQEYVDKIHFHRFDTKAKLESFQFRKYFNDQDVLLINGNHFQGQHQVVLVDPRKEKSLRKRADQLVDVRLILLNEGVTEVLPYVKELIPGWAEIPTFSIQDTPQIAGFLKNAWEQTTPKLKGLVLAGGKSSRMGRDKGLLNYHGRPQRDYLLDLLRPLCSEVYLSLREEGQDTTEDAVIYDTFTGLGPFGALLSAFREDPNAAWLIVACDLPLLDTKTLEFLVANRDTSAYATAFLDAADKFPEPLISIWEPRSYPLALQFLAQGYSCPRKILINSEINLLQAPDTKAFLNVNHPEEYEEIMSKLKHFPTT